MPNRSAFAASIAVTASLISGVVAFGAISATAYRSADTASATELTPAPTAPATVHSDDPATLLAAVRAAAVQPGTVGSTDVPTAPTSGGTRHGDGGDPPDTEKPPPSTTPTTTPPPTTPPSTGPAPYNCSGSDDGLSESVKHAREEYCHAQGFND